MIVQNVFNVKIDLKRYIIVDNRNISYTCNECNNGEGGEIKFTCKCKSCHNKSWSTIKGFINHFRDRGRRDDDIDHQDNQYIYDIFGVKPCGNLECKNYIKLINIIKFKFGKISKNNDGYCYACHHIKKAEQLKNGKILGIYNDIDNIYKLSTNVEDTIPEAIIHEFIDLLKFIFKKINNAPSNELIILYTKILFLAPKVILARPQRNGMNEYNDKIRLYKRRIMAFRSLDSDAILNVIAKIIQQQKEFDINKQQKYKQEENMTELQKKKQLERKIIRKMQKCLKFGSYSKAYKATEMKESIKMTPDNYTLFKSKFINNHKQYDECKLDKLKVDYKCKIDINIMDKLIQKLDSATSAGIDGISAFHMKQIWKNADNEFKLIFIKYIQRIINANITEFELQNIAIALTTPLAKDKQIIYYGKQYEKDIRPIMIATIFLRLAVNVAVTLNMDQILQNKLKNQYGVGVKDSLLLIVHSFDRYCYYKYIINNGLNNIQNYNLNDANPNKLKKIIKDLMKK